MEIAIITFLSPEIQEENTQPLSISVVNRIWNFIAALIHIIFDDFKRNLRNENTWENSSNILSFFFPAFKCEIWKFSNVCWISMEISFRVVSVKEV